MNTYEIETKLKYSLAVDHHPATSKAKGILCYYHGGGLLFGTRTDLPRPYLEHFCQAGYHVLCFDYLLAPEATLDHIQESVRAGLEWFYNKGQTLLEGTDLPYFLFGRSAGAYLALTAACRHIDPQHAPTAVLSFYGYTDLTNPIFSLPNFYYRKLPLIGEAVAKSYICTGFISNAPKEQRFSLYVWARQTGKWVSLLTGNDPTMAEKWSLSSEELQGLPPLFLTASTADQDVPFSFSKHLATLHSQAIFHPVFYLEHDFDRDPECRESNEVYDACLDFLEKHCKTPTTHKNYAHQQNDT